jgi:hypothetical protein
MHRKPLRVIASIRLCDVDVVTEVAVPLERRF